MKRLGSSDSLGALIAEEQSPISNNNNINNVNNNNSHMYGSSMSSMLDGLVEEEEIVGGSHSMGEKKRRLSVDQVKALEKNFEVENKLEPERKVKLAQELGLQPRQVAVWFQNRRARWKTKQLERDYGVLKANYDNLKLNFDSLQQDNQALLKQIKDLKSRLEEEGEEKSSEDVKEEIITTLQAEVEVEAELIHHRTTSSDQELNYECFNRSRNDVVVGGASDSDTSAILNEDNNNAGISSPDLDLDHRHHQISSSSCFQLQKTTTFHTHHQYVKMEEHNFFTAADDACNFFSDEQPPTLQWCWT